MTATIGDLSESTLTTTFVEPKKEPSLINYLAPLDLTTKSAKLLKTSPYPTYTKSSYERLTPPTNHQNFYEEKERRTSLGSSPRSNSSSESFELSSTTCDSFLGLTSTTPKTRTTRPFKAYPKDPMSLAIGCTNADLIINSLSTESGDSYAEFRAKMMEQVKTHMTNTTNKNMRRNNSTGSQIDDPSYWEKRRKNNEAAKRSRDARRAKEDEIAIRCAFLEREHIRMKHENLAMKTENTELKYRVTVLESEINRLRSNGLY